MIILLVVGFDRVLFNKSAEQGVYVVSSYLGV